MINFNGKQHLSIEELSEYLPEKPSQGTIYQWTYNQRIPYRKFGRRLYFEKEQIDLWNEKGRPFTFQMD